MLYGIRFVSTRGSQGSCINSCVDLDGPAIGGSGLTAYRKEDAQERAAGLNRYVSPGCAYLIVPLPQYEEIPCPTLQKPAS